MRLFSPIPAGWRCSLDLLPPADLSGTVMARHGSGSPRPRRNSKLDSFLRRHTEQAVYDGIRFCEPCVVISETVDKAYMHVVLSDERVFLTEYTPRTLTAALSFGRVRDIALVRCTFGSDQTDSKFDSFAVKLAVFGFHPGMTSPWARAVSRGLPLFDTIALRIVRCIYPPRSGLWRDLNI